MGLESYILVFILHFLTPQCGVIKLDFLNVRGLEMPDVGLNEKVIIVIFKNLRLWG